MRGAVPSSMRSAGGQPFSTAGSCHRLPGESIALADAAPLLRDVLSRDPSSFAAGARLPPLPFCFRSMAEYADLFRRCVVEETAEVVREDAQKSSPRQPWAGGEQAKHTLHAELRMMETGAAGQLEVRLCPTDSTASHLKQWRAELEAESMLLITPQRHAAPSTVMDRDARGSSGRGGERRIDLTDGRAYTKATFHAKYGGFRQWDMSAPANAGAWALGCVGLVVRAAGPGSDGTVSVRLSSDAKAAALGPDVQVTVSVRRLEKTQMKLALRSYAALGAFEGKAGLGEWAGRFLLSAAAAAPPPPSLVGASVSATTTAAVPRPPWPRSTWKAPFEKTIRGRFNADQQHAIWTCAAAREGIQLLQGPPGTGKTTTVVGIIAALLALPPPEPPPPLAGDGKAARGKAVKMPKLGSAKLPSNSTSPDPHAGAGANGGAGLRRQRRILVCAQSNAAIDEVVARLLVDGVIDAITGKPRSLKPNGSHAPLLRLGPTDSDKMATTSSPVALDLLVEEKRGGGGGQSRDWWSARLLAEAEVVCATLAGAGTDNLLALNRPKPQATGHAHRPQLPPFDAIIVDEATQASEPELLVALQHGAPIVTLVGDEMQLPPTIKSEAARAAGLGVSPFERLVRAGQPKCMLTIQYRMHPSLAHFPSKQFYHGRLTDGVSERERPVPPGIPWPNPGMPLTLIDVPNGKQKGTESSKSLFNMEEAEAAVRAVYMLITSAAGADARPLDTSDVGIVTPYSRQVEEIKKLAQKRLGAATAARLEVRTVDGFQGREKEVILFSCVRAAPLDKNGPHEIGFLSDGRRMNVAITRAKRGLLVLANVRTLRHARSVTPRSMPAAATEEGSLEPTDGARAWQAFVEDAEARGLLLDAAVLPPVPDSACRRTTLSDAADSDDDSHSDGEGGSSSKRGRGHGWMGPGAKRSRHAPW